MGIRPVEASSEGSRTSIRRVWGGGGLRREERVAKVYCLWGAGEGEAGCWVEPVGVWVVVVEVLVEDWKGGGGAVFSFRRRWDVRRKRAGVRGSGGREVER